MRLLLDMPVVDRLLVAQAQIEGMALVTRDQWIRQYDVQVVPV